MHKLVTLPLITYCPLQFSHHNFLQQCQLKNKIEKLVLYRKNVEKLELSSMTVTVYTFLSKVNLKRGLKSMNCKNT